MGTTSHRQDGNMVRITALDHIVLRVSDVERSLRWYTERLGLAPVRVEQWRAGECPFPSVRVSAETIIDLIEGDVDHDRRNLDHFCMVVSADDLAAARSSDEFEIVRDPDFELYGARGYADGLYIVDPDGNEIELRSYPGDDAGLR
ncbi:MAG: VOC family virulence protein [Chloroflexi bacterium]|nr:VOC family virulence protein [Chloroflexota bacterium]MYF21806.1 VOC family virulence protein [Chloroflexota bacterium]